MRRGAVATLEKIRPTLSAEDFTACCLDVLRDFAEGSRYDFGSRLCVAAMETQPGVVAMVSILLEVKPVEAFDLIMGAPDHIQRGIEAVAALMNRRSRKEPTDAEAS